MLVNVECLSTRAGQFESRQSRTFALGSGDHTRMIDRGARGSLLSVSIGRNCSILIPQARSTTSTN